jgi:hypothetical protein
MVRLSEKPSAWMRSFGTVACGSFIATPYDGLPVQGCGFVIGCIGRFTRSISAF